MAHKVLMTGKIKPGAFYEDLMTFITNEKCFDAKLRRLVCNEDIDGIMDYARTTGNYIEQRTHFCDLLVGILRRSEKWQGDLKN